jgi:FAD synthetase
MSANKNPNLTRVGLIIVGNEILSGKIADTNTAFAIKRLREVGALCIGIATVPDDIERIAEVVRDMRDKADWLITSGGIGPTHDDVTKYGIAAAFDVKISLDPEMEGYIRSAYGDQVNEMHLRMAEIPRGTKIINRKECAIPLLLFHNIYIFPGIPQLFEACFDAAIENFRGSPYELKTVYLTSFENDIAHLIASVATSYPEVEIGSYPKLQNPDYRVCVTFESKVAKDVDIALQQFLSLIPSQEIFQIS